MKSNYKRIGSFIELVDERNRDLAITTLLGLTIDKQFIPSVANIIGSDMANYKIIRKGQFACSLMQVRRDKKIPVALLADLDEAIISQAYPVFRITDEKELLPEYLMMWMRRSEFDREACFYAVGGVRGSLEWDDFCSMELPVPGIGKQREIVKEYNIIVDRIALNEQLNQKLEETAQTLYKQWFIDFEFPISAEYAKFIGKPELEGQHYKSSGGEMVYNEALSKEIPTGWSESQIEPMIRFNYASYNPSVDKFKSLEYLDTSSITRHRIENLQSLVIGQDTIPSRAKRKVDHNDIVYSTVRPNLRHYGLVKNPQPNMVASTGFMVIQPTDDDVSSELILLWITSDEIIDYFHSKAEMSVSTYPSIKPEDILGMWVARPDKTHIKTLNRFLKPLYALLCEYNSENLRLRDLSNILHQKLARV